MSNSLDVAVEGHLVVPWLRCCLVQIGILIHLVRHVGPIPVPAIHTDLFSIWYPGSETEFGPHLGHHYKFHGSFKQRENLHRDSLTYAELMASIHFGPKKLTDVDPRNSVRLSSGSPR